MQPSLLIGRHEECDIRVQLPTVSRRHATFEVDVKSGRVSIRDHSAVNKTNINGTEIDKVSIIGHGDEITVGDRKFRFEYHGGKTPSGEFDVQGDAENVAPSNNAALEGDATQHLSKFVRVQVPKKRTMGATSNTLGAAKAKTAAPTAPTAAAPAVAGPAVAAPAVAAPAVAAPAVAAPAVAAPTAAAAASTSTPKPRTPAPPSLPSVPETSFSSISSLGTTVAVVDSFKYIVPAKSLPLSLINAIKDKRRR